ncbi:HigA family addiction module antitoxin [Gemmobacter sp. 24YEA27]|uniref:HigA family addiction module antitoxin n=1 Tax=Gemmobacter sp. 24YEA27 TaxID=3040672 RepID=UPI0024B35ADD|nr:HigA family addiction module antitoxin [Gemmobacter sp. 24YEA27]
MKIDPLHPGFLVRKDCLDAYDLGVVDGARILGVTRQALSNVVNGRAAISPEMAVRLAKAFGGNEENWLQLQLAYDLAQVRKRAHMIVVSPVAMLARNPVQPRLP